MVTGHQSSLSGVVLAGGKSTRMGCDKAMLVIDGETLLARVVRPVQEVVDEVLVVGPDNDVALPRGTRSVPDAWPSTGPLGGLATGLIACRHAYAFVVACDMPFLNFQLVRYLTGLIDGEKFDAIVPKVKGRPEPLHAVYGKTALPLMVARLGDSRRHGLGIQDLFPSLLIRWVEEAEMRDFDPELASFRNINTPDDWKSMDSVLPPT